MSQTHQTATTTDTTQDQAPPDQELEVEQEAGNAAAQEALRHSTRWMLDWENIFIGSDGQRQEPTARNEEGRDGLAYNFKATSESMDIDYEDAVHQFSGVNAASSGAIMMGLYDHPAGKGKASAEVKYGGAPKYEATWSFDSTLDATGREGIQAAVRAEWNRLLDRYGDPTTIQDKLTTFAAGQQGVTGVEVEIQRFTNPGAGATTNTVDYDIDQAKQINAHISVETSGATIGKNSGDSSQESNRSSNDSSEQRRDHTVEQTQGSESSQTHTHTQERQERIQSIVSDEVQQEWTKASEHIDTSTFTVDSTWNSMIGAEFGGGFEQTLSLGAGLPVKIAGLPLEASGEASIGITTEGKIKGQFDHALQMANESTETTKESVHEKVTEAWKSTDLQETIQTFTESVEEQLRKWEEETTTDSESSVEQSSEGESGATSESSSWSRDVIEYHTSKPVLVLQ